MSNIHLEHSCDSANPTDIETIEVRAIPHRFRHAALLGAISSLQLNEALILSAPHLPNPLLRQINFLSGKFEFSLLQDGPETWLIQITRTAL